MATFASYDFLQVSRRGGSLVDVVLDRPKKLNALDLAMVRECADAVGKTVDLAAEGRWTSPPCARLPGARSPKRWPIAACTRT